METNDFRSVVSCHKPALFRWTEMYSNQNDFFLTAFIHPSTAPFFPPSHSSVMTRNHFRALCSLQIEIERVWGDESIPLSLPLLCSLALTKPDSKPAKSEIRYWCNVLQFSGDTPTFFFFQCICGFIKHPSVMSRQTNSAIHKYGLAIASRNTAVSMSDRLDRWNWWRWRV